MDETVLLGHGSGGTMMKRIIDDVFFEAYAGEELLEGGEVGGTRGAHEVLAAEGDAGALGSEGMGGVVGHGGKGFLGGGGL